MDVETRLHRVERQLGFYKMCALALVILVASLTVREFVSLAQAGPDASPVAETIQARKFEVVNADGVVVARLSAGLYNSGDLVLNGYSKPFSLIRSIQLYGSGIAFHSKTIDPSVDMSQILVTIGADENGGLIATYNGEEKLSVGLRAADTGDGQLTVADREGRATVIVGTDAASTGTVKLLHHGLP